MCKFKLMLSKAFLVASILSVSILGNADNGKSTIIFNKQNCTQQGCACHTDMLTALGRVAGVKALNNIPLIPGSSDFPLGGVQSLTADEQEQFRKGVTEGLATSLGDHVGWKLGLAAATTTTPSLGYEAPIYGELLDKMIIVGNNVNVRPDFALSTAAEADMLFVVKNEAINAAVTPQDILKNVRGIYPAIELPAAFTPTFIPYAFGPRNGGDGILRVTNIAARIFVRADKVIPIPGGRSLADWEQVLNGGLHGTDLLVRTSGNLSGVAPPVQHLTNTLNLIRMLNARGLMLQPGDLVSPGTGVATRITNGTEQSFTVTYDNMDPKGSVQVNVNYTADGVCCGSMKNGD